MAVLSCFSCVNISIIGNTFILFAHIMTFYTYFQLRGKGNPLFLCGMLRRESNHDIWHYMSMHISS